MGLYIQAQMELSDTTLAPHPIANPKNKVPPENPSLQVRKIAKYNTTSTWNSGKWNGGGVNKKGWSSQR